MSRRVPESSSSRSWGSDMGSSCTTAARGRRGVRGTDCRRPVRGCQMSKIGGAATCSWPVVLRTFVRTDTTEIEDSQVQEKLIIRGAREHNLKDISLDLPRDSLIVFTGLSGPASPAWPSTRSSPRASGATSSRCRRTPASSWARWTSPTSTSSRGSSPAVSIDQKSTSKNPRSTVGTITEVYDYLRLLYARAGRPHCPVCRSPIERQTPQQIVDRVMALEEGTRFQVLAPVIRGRKGEYIELFRELQTQGFSRARVNGETHALERPTHARQAEEAHHRGRGRPARGQGVVEAPAHRLGRDRAQPRRRPGRLRPRRPAGEGPGPRAEVQREDGLPQRPPDRHRRARAAVVLVQHARSAPARSAAASAPAWRSTPSWSSPTRRRPWARARSSRGARPTSPTTSCG